MKKLFVPYELALKLKEKGFDEPCIAVYREGKLKFPVTGNFDLTNSIIHHSSDITAPLYQQVIGWFIEKDIWFNIGLSGDRTFFMVIYKLEDGTLYNEKGFETLNEALNKAIKQTLKLLK